VSNRYCDRFARITCWGRAFETRTDCFQQTPGEYARRLIPIDEIEADEEVWEDERAFRRDRLTEDINPVPGYPEPPEYIPPPVYDE